MPIQVIVLGVIAFLLSGMPKLRVVIGMPLYAVDFLILYLLIISQGKEKLKYKSAAQIIVNIVGLYLVFVMLGELRGGFVYGKLFDAFYMLFRFMMAGALFYQVPIWIKSPNDLKVVLKGLCLGLLFSAIMAILFSLPFTRPLVVRSVFSITFLNPVDMLSVLEYGGVSRGSTLIGTSTFSSGVMATLWPLLLMGGALLGARGVWRKLNLAALFIVPVGILVTYGRSAWASVILVVCVTILWGSRQSRTAILLWLIIVGSVVAKVGIEYDLFMIERVVKSTEIVVDNPLERDNERERFMAYVEPFRHVSQYPSFFLFGTGVANRKYGGNIFGEADSASHAVPGIAYYAYGVGGSICQIMLMLFGVRLVSKRLVNAKRCVPQSLWMWHALLAAGFGLLPWWLFGHGIITQPRGSMVFFLSFGILMACERMGYEPRIRRIKG